MSLADFDPHSDAWLAACLDLLMDGMIKQSRREMTLPHVVICHDAVTGVTSHQGPYEDGFSALCSAEREASHPDTSDLVFTVAPLLPTVP